jgi:hypothetical protein
VISVKSSFRGGANTARAKVTRGEIEQRMKANLPEGYSFVDCNWKKRKARFVNATGTLRYVSFY